MGIRNRHAPRRQCGIAVGPTRARSARALGLALFLATAGLAPPVPAGADPNATVAVVGSETVTGSEYQNYLRMYVRSQLYHGGSKERLRELAGEALDNLVTDRLLVQEARRQGITTDEKEIEKQVKALRDRYSSDPNWPQLEPQLLAIAEKLRTDSLIERLRDTVTEIAPPTEAVLTAFYEANLELFTEPAAWDLDLVLVGVPPSASTSEWHEASERASSIAALLRAGESFEEIARVHSTDRSAADGGKLGKVHKGQLPEEVQAEIDKLGLGEITEPIRTLEGYAIIRFNGDLPSQTFPLEDVRERAEALYLRNTASERWTAFVALLRDSTNVETFDVSAHVEALIAGE